MTGDKGAMKEDKRNKPAKQNIRQAGKDREDGGKKIAYMDPCNYKKIKIKLGVKHMIRNREYVKDAQKEGGLKHEEELERKE